MPANLAKGFRQLPDPRDANFPLSALMGAGGATPISKVWKPGPVTNQGSESSCVGHSTFKLLTSDPRPLKTPAITPSRIYVEAKNIDEWQGSDYDGTSVRAGLDVLKSRSFIDAYYWAGNIEEVTDYLLRFGPLVLGIRWTSSMDSPVNGIIKPKGKGGGGHAILAYAADWKKKLITIRNSWGTMFGKMGDCAIAFPDLNLLLKEGGVAAAITKTQA